ncbi:MAG: NAD(P)/FAD-dependent oxidoreductase, partial [Desulfomonilaceae bacterium]
TGLVAAHRLVKQGLKVTIVEASPILGGLASSVTLKGMKPVEKYYHFICREDNDLINFIDELNLSHKLSWREGSTSIFVNGKTYHFNTPLDLLNFSPIPFSQRVRFGINIIASEFRKNWKGLDKIAAKPFLINRIGQAAYMAIWDPLLRIKFGEFHEEVSAAWVWHRIHRISRSRTNFFGTNSYGFLEQGCFTLVQRIVQNLIGHDGCSMIINRRVSKILIKNDRVSGLQFENGQTIDADFIISTCSIPNFIKLLDSLGTYGAKLASIRYLDIVCALFELDRSFSNNFWLNVNDPRISFNGLVETTNLNPRTDLKGSHLLYIPYYLTQINPRWSWSDSQYYDDYVMALKLIEPNFNEKWILNFNIFRDANAQAVCKLNFLEVVPEMRTPIKGLYINDSAQYYPEDRTLSASVRLGTSVSEFLIRDLRHS